MSVYYKLVLQNGQMCFDPLSKRQEMLLLVDEKMQINEKLFEKYGPIDDKDGDNTSDDDNNTNGISDDNDVSDEHTNDRNWYSDF